MTERGAASRLSDAAQLFEAGRLDAAAELCAAVRREQPRSFDAAFLLGAIRGGQGLMAAAAACFRDAAALDPRSFPAQRNLGVALSALGQHEAAAASFARALELNPKDAATHNDLGVTLARLRRHEGALAHFDRALALKPGFADAIGNRGATLLAIDRAADAVATFERVLALNQRDADAHHNLGTALNKLRRHADAIASFERAIMLRPDHAAANNGLGVALAALGREEAAAASFERALALQPGYLEARLNLANVLRSVKRYEAALANAMAVLEGMPDDAAALTLAAALKRHLCRWEGLAEIDARLLAQVAAGKGAVLPFVFLTVVDDPAAQMQCARQYWMSKRAHSAERPLTPTLSPRGEGGTGPRFPSPQRGEGPGEGAAPRRTASPTARLRLGYLSADFHDHATARLAASLFEAHDRTRFEVVAFSTGPDDRSAMRRRLQAGFDRFFDLRRESDEAVAACIRDAGIDILIDLKGYTEEGRLDALAPRAAPLQVHYLGYPGTLGGDAVDYFIADRIVVPPGAERFFTEQLVFLDGCYQVNDRHRAIAAETPSRAQAGLPENGFVFCCFNNNYKITPAVFDVWMRLLAAVEGSVLWLLADRGSEDNLRREAESRGVDPRRLVFAPRLPLAAHLARHRVADLFLDTAPVNAHTTASDALWAGLPLMTCAGQSFVARVAASLLSALGLAEIVTADLEQYERLALAFARDPARLAALRRRLEAARLTAPLFDTLRTCRQLETAYLTMEETRRRGDPPRSFTVRAP
ncbi:MAG TPA: tetratricopeptide repeat protein [Stellaceae bacterium]|nr:tetratricopeptide repeat protein [Stellaceae bacterium]